MKHTNLLFRMLKRFIFYDRDYNIVGLIALKNISFKSATQFGPSSFMEISEIGMPTDDIDREYRWLNSIAGIGLYSGSFERFRAISDEHGLFMVLNRATKDGWFPTNDPVFGSSFRALINERGYDYDIQFINDGVRIINN